MQVNLSKPVYDKLTKLSKELDMPRAQVVNMLISEYRRLYGETKNQTS